MHRSPARNDRGDDRWVWGARPAWAAASWRADRAWLLPLLVLFLAKGALLISIIGPFTGHDEVDHFFYVARLAEGGGLGVVGEEELPPAAAPYRAYVADYPYNAEVIQPPLYHALLTPLYWLVSGSAERKLYALRGVSVVVGAGVVVLAYATARLLFPDDSGARIGVPVFVAWQPQFAFEAAIVNHDVLVIALSSLLVFLLLRWLPGGYSTRRQLILGSLAAAGLWTKASFVLALPLVAICLLWDWRDRGRAGRWLVGAGVRALGLPLALALPWLARGWWLYGDPTGASRLRAIPGYGEQASGLGAMLGSAEFWRGRLEDFWGNYGWRLIPFDIPVYRAIWGAWALAAVGLGVLAVRGAVAAGRGRTQPLTRYQWRGLALMGLWAGLMIGGVLYVGTIQFTQSRFAFPAMVGFATLTVVGLEQLLPRRWRPAVGPALIVGLTLLNVVVAIRFLIPFYYGAQGATVLTE